MSELVEKAAQDVESMSQTLTEMKASLDAKMEEVLKAQAGLQREMIKTNEEEKEVGKTYGFLQAKKDFEAGKTSRFPMWDSKTTGKFNEYLHMLYEKDLKGIQKTWGDNVQDNVSNWTPTEFRSELIRLAYVSSLALQKCTIIPMGRDKVEMPAPTGNYTVSWLGAGAEAQDSKLTIGKLTLDTSKLAGLALVNKEDLDDSAYPVSLVVANQMGEDFGKKIDEEVFQGDDSDTSNHKFDGWEYATNVQAVTGPVDATPTLAELVTEANLLAVVGKLDDLQVDGAEWFMVNGTWNTIRALEDGSNSKIVRLNENYRYNLLGYPVHTRAQVGTTPTVLRAALFFGNMKHIYIGDRMDFRIETSEHYRFANDQIVFRGLQRLAVVVALPTALVKLAWGADS